MPFQAQNFPGNSRATFSGNKQNFIWSKRNQNFKLKVFFLENPIKIKPNTVEYNHGLIKLNPPILTLLTTGNKKGNAISSTELSWKLKSYIPCINKQKFILYTHQSNIIINTIIHNVSLISPRKLKAKKKKKHLQKLTSLPGKTNYSAIKNKYFPHSWVR